MITPVMRSLLIFLVLLLELGLLPAWGQQVMTLEDCIAYALEHSPRLERARHETSSARAERLMAIGALLPQVTIGSSLSASSGRGIDPKTNTYTTVSSLRNSYSIDASMVLFDGLANVHRVRRQRIEQRIALSRELVERRKLRMEIVQAYYKALFLYKLVDQTKSSLASAETLLKKINRMHELGMKSSTDLAEVSAQHANALLQHTQSVGAYRLMLLELMVLMHYPEDMPLNIATIEPLPTTLEMPTVSPEEAYRQALGWLPEVRCAQEAVRSARMAQYMALGAFAPRLSLGVGYSTSFFKYMDGSPYEPFVQQLRNRGGQYIGLTLSIDLFSGFRHLGALRQRRAAYRSALVAEQETMLQIRKDMESAILELRTAVDRYQAMRSLVEHRTIVYQGILRGFETGRNSALELTQALDQRTDAEAQLLEAYTTYRLHQAWVIHYTAPEAQRNETSLTHTL